MLEIIDDNENVIGLAPRKDFHDPKRKEKLLHRAVHVIVIDVATGKIWAQKRSEKMDLYPETWEGGVGGHVDPGETPEQAALRECEEEFGLKPNVIFFLGKYFYEDEFQRQLNYVFWFKTKEKPRLSPEAAKQELMSVKDFEKLISEGKTPPDWKNDFEIAREKKLF